MKQGIANNPINSSNNSINITVKIPKIVVQEEVDTVGTRDKNKAGNLTENKIRDEHGLTERGQYW